MTTETEKKKAKKAYYEERIEEIKEEIEQKSKIADKYGWDDEDRAYIRKCEKQIAAIKAEIAELEAEMETAKAVEVEETSDNANEIATEKNYIEQLGTQKIHHAENLVAALESFDEKIESGAGIKSLENAARKIDRSVKQIEEINHNIAAHEKRIADLENEETSDVAKFKVGKMYQAYHLYFDTPHKWNFKVLKRTAKYITVCDDFDDEGEKETFRVKISFDERYGGEYVESKTEDDSIGCRIRADREYIPENKKAA